jgi:uncharacterized repeat protein (TIGR01451 family)
MKQRKSVLVALAAAVVISVLLANAVAAAGDPTSLYVEVNYSKDVAEGRAAADAEVTASVQREGAEIGSGNATSRVDGWFTVDLGKHFGVDVRPGDQVRVTGGGLDETVEVISIEGTIDPAADTVSGQMFKGVFPAQGRVNVGEPGSKAGDTLDVAIDGDGHYLADFSSRYDIAPTTEARVYYQDPDGNWVLAEIRQPFLRVHANRTHDWVQGEAPQNTNVVVRLLRGGTEIGRGESHTGGGTWFNTNIWAEEGKKQADIQTGDAVEVTAGGLSATVLIVDIVGAVDAPSGRVSGQVRGVPYPANVRVEVWTKNGPSLDLQTGGAGNFLADFGASAIAQGDNVGIWYVRPDGHWSGIVRSDFQLNTELTSDGFYGGTTPGARVDLTLSSPGQLLAAVKGTATVWASDDGQFGGGFSADGKDKQRVDIAPGDIITAQADGKTVTVAIPSPFTAVYDHLANTVCGQAPPNAELQVDLWKYGTEFVTVEASGEYCADFSTYGDPQIGDQGSITLCVVGGHNIGLQFGTPSPDLWVQKWADDQPAVGRDFRWFLKVGNSEQASATASNVTVTDTLPAGASFVNESSGTATVVGNQVIMNLGTLEVGEERPITLTVHVDAGVPVGSNLENCVQAASDNWERDAGKNGTCDGRQVVPDEVDLGVGKWASPGDPTPGQEMVYFIDYYNNRPASALNVHITDTLPARVTFVSEWHPAGWSVDTSTPGQVVWSRDELPGWHKGYLELRGRVHEGVPIGEGGLLINRVRIETSSNDVEPKNDAQEQHVGTKEPYANLWVGKWYGGGSPVAGLTYSTWIQVQDHGNVPATGVVLTDIFPANTTLERVMRLDWNPATGNWDLEVDLAPDAVGPGWARWNLGTVVSWRPVQLRVDLRIGETVPPWTELKNVVDVSAAEPDADPKDNHAVYDFTTQPAGPNLRAAKKFEWGEALPGGTLQYQLHFDSDGTEPALNVVLTDTLPAGVILQGHGFWQEPVVKETPGTPPVTQLIWGLQQMNPGETQDFWVQVRVNDDTPVGAVLTNRLEVSTASNEVRLDDNMAEAPVRVGPDLRVDKQLADTKNPVLPGQEIVYYIRVWNGDAAVNDAGLTDYLPEGCTYAWDDWGGQVQDGMVVWSLGKLDPGWHGEFKMGVKVGRDVPFGTVLVNTIEVGNPLGDANPADNLVELPVTVQGPYIRVQESHNWVEGQVLPNAYANVTVRGAGGAVKQTINTTSGEDGHFWAGFNETDIVPGDQVEVDTEGSPLISIDVIRIEGTVDVAANSISGHVYGVTYPAGIRGEVWIKDGTSVQGQTDGFGDYLLDFSPFDVRSGHQVALWYIRPDGNEVGIVRTALFVQVYPTDDVVTGMTAAGLLVSVELRDSEGDLKGTAQATSDQNGNWKTEVFNGAGRVEIDDHDVVLVTAGANVASVTVPRILVLPDAAHDQMIVDSELPDTWLQVRWDSAPNDEKHDLKNQTEITTDSSGFGLVDFGPLGGLDVGVDGNLYYTNGDGHVIEPWWRAMIASVTPNELANDSDHTIFIAGAGFRPTPAAVLLGVPTQPPSVHLTGVTCIAGGLLQVTVPAGTPPGAYYILVPNPDERLGYLADALTIHGRPALFLPLVRKNS